MAVSRIYLMIGSLRDMLREEQLFFRRTKDIARDTHDQGRLGDEGKSTCQVGITPAGDIVTVHRLGE